MSDETKWLPEPTFQVVQCIRYGFSGWTVEGVYSKDDDAAERVHILDQSQFVKPGGTTTQRVPMETVIQIIMEGVLKELADPLLTMRDIYDAEKADKINPEQRATLPAGEQSRESGNGKRRDASDGGESGQHKGADLLA